MQMHNHVLEEPMSHVYVITTRCTNVGLFAGPSLWVSLIRISISQEV